MTKAKYIGRPRLGLNRLIVRDSFPFQVKQMSNHSNVIEQDLISLDKLGEQQKNQRAIKNQKKN